MYGGVEYFVRRVSRYATMFEDMTYMELLECVRSAMRVVSLRDVRRLIGHGDGLQVLLDAFAPGSNPIEYATALRDMQTQQSFLAWSIYLYLLYKHNVQNSSLEVSGVMQILQSSVYTDDVDVDLECYVNCSVDMLCRRCTANMIREYLPVGAHQTDIHRVDELHASGATFDLTCNQLCAEIRSLYSWVPILYAAALFSDKSTSAEDLILQRYSVKTVEVIHGCT